MSDLVPRIENLERDRDAAFARIDEYRRMIETVNRNYAEIKTVLVGITGGNGLKGEVANLDREFSAFRAEVRQAREDDRTALDEYRRREEESRKSSMRFTVGTVITVGGLIIAAMRLFV